MATNQTFVDFVTPVPADWLNNVNFVVNQYPFVGSTNTFVPTIATLKLLDHTKYTSTIVLGYAVAGDGGGGLYYYNSSDTTSTDNGGSIIVANDGARWYLSWRNEIDIRQFGAKVDGITDDSTAVQNCINYLESVTGGTVRFPKGTTLINTGITVHNGGIKLEGLGWQEYNGVEGANPNFGTNSSWIYTTNTATSPITFANTVEHASITDLAFRQLQPADITGWTPTVYPPCIMVAGASYSGGSVIMERLFCWHCYEFIRLGSIGNFTGRATMKHIWGQPLSIGINMIASSDTALIDDVHFWPFDTVDLNIVNWIQVHGIGIQVTRSDNFIGTNIFEFGYSVGIRFQSSTDGSTERFQLTNIGHDSCYTGLQFAETNGLTSGQITNYYVAGAGTLSGSYGLNAAGVNNLILDITNFRSTRAGAAGIALSGSADVSVVNCFIDDWNQSATASPALNIGTGCTLKVGNKLRFSGGGGAALFGGAGVFMGPEVHGSVGATTDGSGNLTISHNIGATPSVVLVTLTNASQAIFAQVSAITSTTFIVHFFNSSGAALTGVALSFAWQASL